MQMKRTVLVAALAVAAGSAMAQTACPVPVVHDQQEVPSTGSALVPQVTVQVNASAKCPDNVSYQFNEAELTLVRGRRPILPTKRVSQSEVDLSDMMKVVRPGDRVFVFVPFKNLTVVSADGKHTPYPMTDLNATDQNGVGFNWLIVQK
jgi:hypothetical protein